MKMFPNYTNSEGAAMVYEIDYDIALDYVSLSVRRRAVWKLKTQNFPEIDFRLSL